MEKASIAAKWSTITEVFTKLISPIVQMILARILDIEAFGVIAIINLIITFTDMFTDAGFQKYLIQKDFKSLEEQENYTNVAFWTNLSLSMIIWISIIIFREEIASLVNYPDLGLAIAIACFQLPLSSLSSIQMALYRREFNFKTLFYLKLIISVIPLLISVPLAYLGFSYWSLIVAAICSQLVSAIFLTMKSDWKPTLYYSFTNLQRMFKFSSWSLLESISIWLTSWVDILIIATILSPYFLGIYSNSLNMVNTIMAIVTTSITTVLFSTLSRLQGNNEVFNGTFLKIHKLTSYLVFPIGVGIYLYSDLATKILFGEKWLEASDVIGIWALTSAIRISMTSIFSEVYRAKGRPDLSFGLQMFDLLIIVPTCLISAQYGFWALVYARAFIRLDLIIPGLIMMDKIMNIKAKKILKNLIKPIISITVMIIVNSIIEKISDTLFWQLISILFCAIVYVSVLLILDRHFIKSLIRKSI